LEVNEFLTASDGHPLPIACTTNLVDRIDRAALRHFLFHVRFDYLTRAQALSLSAVSSEASRLRPWPRSTVSHRRISRRSSAGPRS
jgi:hypothetical protein